MPVWTEFDEPRHKCEGCPRWDDGQCDGEEENCTAKGDIAMERFVTGGSLDTSNARVEAFLDEIVEVCKKYKLSIAHEDHHGAFIIEEYSKTNIDWLHDAHYSKDLPKSVPASWIDQVLPAPVQVNEEESKCRTI
jgi:hypothetical protein